MSTLGMRTHYVLSEEELAELLAACRPVPYLIAGGLAPRSPVENAVAAWVRLGLTRDFDGMSVEPDGENPRHFTAIANPKKAEL